MTLRIKTLLTGVFTLGTLVGVLYVVAVRLLSAGFLEIEKQEATESVQRGVHAFEHAADRLSEATAAWSQWNESYEFIQTKDSNVYQRYVAKNLNDAILAPNNINLILYVRTDGHLVYGTGYDPKASTKVPLPPDILSHLRPGSPFLRPSKTGTRGVLLLRSGAVSMAARTILTDAGRGPARGFLIWGRYVDKNQVNQLAHEVNQPVNLKRLDDTKLAPELLRIRSELLGRSGVIIRPLGEDWVAGYAAIKDIYGQPALLLRVDTDRDVHRQGQKSLRYLLMALFIIGVVFGGLTLWMLERWVLARLSLLSQNVEQISVSGDVSQRVPAAGADELSQLSGNVNRLLAAVEKANHELHGEINVREAAEKSLLQSRDELETRVAERTSELAAANADLRLSKEEAETAREEAEAAREEAEAANLAKSEFLSRMSHELRTPLNAILGFGQILEKGELKPLHRECCSHILRGGRHLLGLINEILDIARVEAGHSDLTIEPVALHDVVSQSCELVRPLAQQRNIKLEIDAATLCGTYVLADWQRLEQVLLNLLSNGIKYNSEGGTLSVACERMSSGRIRLTVRDTGAGINPQDIKKLFAPFERLNAASADIEGSGLGLVLSQRLVSAMGGTIQVESVVGQGSNFFFDLPPADAPAGEPQLQDKRDSADVATEEGRKHFSVLCIEDNVANLRLIEVTLERRQDIKLLAAMQGSVGLDVAREHRPDLILLDLNLPDLSGHEVLARLRAEESTAKIPIIVISADATKGQIERLMAAGARAYLTKPFNIQELLQTVEGILGENEPVNTG